MANKVAIYCRVSTDLQDVTPQVDALQQFCQARGWEIVARYVDQGVSGAKNSRPQLDRLMADARAHRFDLIAVWKVDRFSRSLAHLANAMVELDKLGVGFVSYTDGLDPTTPMGRAMVQLAGVFAELERSLIRERLQAGFSVAREKLKKGPYRRVKDGQLVTGLGRPRSAIDMAKVEQMRSNGLSLRRIAAALGVPLSTLRDRLQRPNLDGKGDDSK